MKHKVAELEGTLLDAAVAKAEGLPFVIDRYEREHDGGREEWVMAARPGYAGADDLGRRRVDRKPFSPSTDWQHGGPIIEREQIAVVSPDISNMGRVRHVKGWHASIPWTIDGENSFASEFGPTPLIAAMRCFVASKFGDEVEL